MQTEIIIAIISGLITLSASLLVAVYQSRAEIRKMVRQLEQKYATSLFDKRLEAYLALFKMLAQISNAVEHSTQSKESLVNFQTQFDDWLSSYGLLLTPSTAQILWHYQGYLRDLLKQYYDASIPEEQWIVIRNTHVTIGKFLRAELGVFDVKPAGIPDLDRPHVRRLLEKLEERSKRDRERFGY